MKYSIIKIGRTSTHGQRMCVTGQARADVQDCQIAFVFAAESEANELYKKVGNRQKYACKSLRLGLPSIPDLASESINV